MITDQEVFNKAYLGIIKQGVPAGDLFGSCNYRIKRGNRTLACAVGQLFPDSAYWPEIENLTVRDLTELAELQPYLGTNVQILTEIQLAHDMASLDPRYDFLRIFKKHMAAVAARFNLTVPQE